MTKTVELGLAFATVVPVKARPSIDSQYLSSNGRLDILSWEDSARMLECDGNSSIAIPCNLILRKEPNDLNKSD